MWDFSGLLLLVVSDCLPRGLDRTLWDGRLSHLPAWPLCPTTSSASQIFFLCPRDPQGIRILEPSPPSFFCFSFWKPCTEDQHIQTQICVQRKPQRQRTCPRAGGAQERPERPYLCTSWGRAAFNNQRPRSKKQQVPGRGRAWCPGYHIPGFKRPGVHEVWPDTRRLINQQKLW